jgi:hypothetical protein
MDAFAVAREKCIQCGIEELLTTENYDDFTRWTKGLDSSIQPPRRPFRELCEDVYSLIDIGHVKAWFLRPWFKRVWTVQEYCLAKEPIFRCGDKSVSARKVRFAWMVLELAPAEVKTADTPMPSGPLPQGPGVEINAKRLEHMKASTAWLDRLKLIRTVQFLSPITSLSNARVRKQSFDKGAGRGLPFFEILKMFARGSMRKATNPRDWIYGLMALPNDLVKLGVVPDYRLSCETIFTQFTRRVVHTGNLEILRHSQYPEKLQYEFSILGAGLEPRSTDDVRL